MFAPRIHRSVQQAVESTYNVLPKGSILFHYKKLRYKGFEKVLFWYTMPKTKRLRPKSELKPEEKSRKKFDGRRALISRILEPPFVRQYRLFKKWKLF